MAPKHKINTHTIPPKPQMLTRTKADISLILNNVFIYEKYNIFPLLYLAMKFSCSPAWFSLSK